jgi:hypothetical protein
VISNAPKPVPTPVTAAETPATNSNAKAIERPGRGTPERQVFSAWQGRGSKPGRIRAAGTALDGKPFDLRAAEPFADFVQVLALEETNDPRKTWVGLRANGKAVWADGSLTLGHVALVRSWKEVIAVSTHGLVQWEGLPEPLGPVTNFSFGRLKYLVGRPVVAAYEDPNETWFIHSPALNKGLAAPDLSTPSIIKKVVVDHAGVGVLTVGGTLRIWNQQEMNLPTHLRQDIRDVQPLGRSWSLLTKEGRVFNFSVLRDDTTGVAALSEPTAIREFHPLGGKAVALGSAGYAPLVKHEDGRWTTDPALTIINETLTQLHQQGNESFSVFSSNGVEGILWIEPVEQPGI